MVKCWLCLKGHKFSDCHTLKNISVELRVNIVKLNKLKLKYLLVVCSNILNEYDGLLKVVINGTSVIFNMTLDMGYQIVPLKISARWRKIYHLYQRR